VFVANRGSRTVSPIFTATNRAGKPIRTGRVPQAIAITPGYKMAYVANGLSDTVTPIRISIGKALRALPPIKVGAFPDAIVISPDGKTAYVASDEHRTQPGTVTPIRTATNTALAPITVGTSPNALAITPNGKTLYVLNNQSDTITPIRTATDTALPPIPTGTNPHVLVLSPDGKTLYVAGPGNSVLPISTRTNKPGHPIPVPAAVELTMAITPDGKTLYVSNINPGGVTPINTASGKAGHFIRTGPAFVLAITPDSKMLYVGTEQKVVQIRTATNTIGKSITLTQGTVADAIAITPDGKMAYISGSANTVTPIRIATNTALAPIHVGHSPDAITATPSLTSPCHICV
jgi:YVTN family beta-propeller protein